MDTSFATPVRAFVLLLAAGFAALVVRAALTADFGESFARVAADPWGLVSLADLYLGFVLFGAIVLLHDGVRAASLGWLVALMVLGNLVAAVWLVLRWPSLAARLRAPRLPEKAARP